MKIVIRKMEVRPLQAGETLPPPTDEEKPPRPKSSAGGG
jgi:hypothetical protein